jgi:Protein of unknown function (DUF3102)
VWLPPRFLIWPRFLSDIRRVLNPRVGACRQGGGGAACARLLQPLKHARSLADDEHEATAAALQRGVKHAMAAGDLLIEAKAHLKTQLGHGKWLPWLAKNCAISERTAQLYIKLAKNRATIEKEMANPQSVADLTLNEAAALCVLAGRLEKMIEFAKRAEELTPNLGDERGQAAAG